MPNKPTRPKTIKSKSCAYLEPAEIILAWVPLPLWCSLQAVCSGRAVYCSVLHLVAPDGADLLARLLLPGLVLVCSQAEEEEVPGAWLQLQQAGEHDRQGVEPSAGGGKCPTPPFLLTRALLGDHHKGCKLFVGRI